MKLSEAIMLGSTLIRLDPYLYLHNDCGCLIGMGARAIGREKLVFKGELDFPEYPWLLDYFPWPLGIGTDSLEGKLFQASVIISRMAFLVSNDVYTLEQALDWIRSVEPQESVTSSADGSKDSQAHLTAPPSSAESFATPQEMECSADSLYSVSEHAFAHSEHVFGSDNARN